VCTENSVRIDYMTEPPNVSGDDRSVMLPPVGTENLIRIDCVTESRDNVRQRTKAPTVSLRRTTIPAFHRKRSPFDV